MLWLDVIVVPEQWDEKNSRFIPPVTKRIQLEHSLVSISKWETKWEKPFLEAFDPRSRGKLSNEEALDYVRCMTITQNIDAKLYDHLSEKNVEAVLDYINAPMTATIFPPRSGPGTNERITSELVYYWMIAYNIPSEYQKWHFNRLMTLIRICSIKNSVPGKPGKDYFRNRAAINAARRAKHHSRG